MCFAWLCSSLWAPLALAEPAAEFKGHSIIDAENARNCDLSVDGTLFGKLPIHTEIVSDGPHHFLVTCPDGRRAETDSRLTLVPGGVAKLTLTGLKFSDPIPEQVSGPIPTYVVIRDFPGKKVRIDGGAAVPLPYLATLTVGPHTFIVVEPSGQERPAVTRDVISKQGRAVVNLD